VEAWAPNTQQLYKRIGLQCLRQYITSDLNYMRGPTNQLTANSLLGFEERRWSVEGFSRRCFSAFEVLPCFPLVVPLPPVLFFPTRTSSTVLLKLKRQPGRQRAAIGNKKTWVARAGRERNLGEDDDVRRGCVRASELP
jgi:hypothetical protein